MKASNMNEKHKEIAEVFIKQYNVTKGTHYKFERLRKSIFSIPKYKFQNLEIYQVAFIEGKKHNSIVANLMVLLRLQKRLLAEVVEPIPIEEDVKDIDWRVVEELIDSVESYALTEVVCSRYLLIDGRSFGRTRISDPEIYKKNRVERDKLVGRHKRELSQVGIPVKHWFKEIWLSYHDEKGVVRCPQIW